MVVIRAVQALRLSTFGPLAGERKSAYYPTRPAQVPRAWGQ